MNDSVFDRLVRRLRQHGDTRGNTRYRFYIAWITRSDPASFTIRRYAAIDGIETAAGTIALAYYLLLLNGGFDDQTPVDFLGWCTEADWLALPHRYPGNLTYTALEFAAVTRISVRPTTTESCWGDPRY